MIHLIKLCVGINTVDELEEHRAHMRAMGLERADGLTVHRTRMMPKRGDDIIGKGSLYWVIKGAVRARQTIVDLQKTTDEDGKSYCDILLAPTIIRTLSKPKRPFQGWRYLKPEDTPRDLDDRGAEDDSEIQNELARLGLL